MDTISSEWILHLLDETIALLPTSDQRIDYVGYIKIGGVVFRFQSPYMLNIYNCSNIKCNILAGLAGWDNLRRFPIVVHVIMVYVGLSQQPENQFACPNPAALDIRDKA